MAATVLLEPEHIGKTYTITGPAAVTHAEVAQAISHATGRDVKFVDIPPEAFADALRNFGMSPWQILGLIEDYAHYARGEAAEVLPTVREITDTEARSIETFASNYANAFKS